jgi:hypothetical protein
LVPDSESVVGGPGWGKGNGVMDPSSAASDDQVSGEFGVQPDAPPQSEGNLPLRLCLKALS